MPVHDAVVVGGGPAGTYLAKRLAEAGRDVVLLERTLGPHQKVCGEFLSHEAIFYLKRVGLDPVRMGAVPISTVALIRNHAVTSVKLPFPAVSLSRYRLDEALITAAGDAGAVVRRGCRVRSIRRHHNAWHVEGDEDAVMARDVFIASGKHDIRGWKRPPGRHADLIGFKQQFRLAFPQARDASNRVELFMFAGGYCGLEPVEGGICNISLVIRKSRFADLGSWEGLWEGMLADSPMLAERMRDAVPVSDRPLAIGAIPYGYVRTHSEGPWHLGDQAAVIPSFAGNGISMALHSAHLAARHYLAGQPADRFQQAFARDVRRQVHNATLLSRLLVSPLTQGLLSAGARYLPGAMRSVAAGTRLPLTEQPLVTGAR
ncbi:MAG: electron transfer flavoprotein [Alphaproteobacteria bacterium]|nr:electron transfer flavoprotein [Alphaproteobacteria bacterium]